MAEQPPRSAEQRKRDTLARLESDVDAWVASAGDGGAHLVPLSFVWDGTALTFATGESSVTARNLRASGHVRLGIGPTRDLVLIEGTVETFSREAVPAELADAFAAKLWDARLAPNVFMRVTPRRIQAWREEGELPGRVLMRDGRWLV